MWDMDIGEIQHPEAERHDFRTQGDLVGYLIKVQKNVGFNRQSRLYTIEREDGTIVCLWGSVALDRQLGFCKIGEKVKISLKGKKKSPTTGRFYKNYIVYRSVGKASK